MLPTSKSVLFILSLAVLCKGDGHSGEPPRQKPGPGFVVEFNEDDTYFKFVTIDGDKTLLLRGPLLRVGRQPTIAEHRAYLSHNMKYWQPYTLQPAALLGRASGMVAGNSLIEARHEFSRPGEPAQIIELDFRLALSPNGWIDVDYVLRPNNLTDHLLAFGISFLLPREMRTFAWRGDGPESSFGVSPRSPTRGVFRFVAAEHYFDGNKSNVDLAAVFDQHGNGVGMIGSAENLECSIDRDGTLLSHHLLVAGTTTEREPPRDVIEARALQPLKGHLRLVPLLAGEWPREFIGLSPFETQEFPIQLKRVQ